MDWKKVIEENYFHTWSHLLQDLQGGKSKDGRQGKDKKLFVRLLQEEELLTFLKREIVLRRGRGGRTSKVLDMQGMKPFGADFFVRARSSAFNEFVGKEPKPFIVVEHSKKAGVHAVWMFWLTFRGGIIPGDLLPANPLARQIVFATTVANHEKELENED